MAKPGKIKMATDDKKKFNQPGVIELLRQIAEKNGWRLGLAVWAASEAVRPKAPADVSSADLEAATPEIVSRGKREKDGKDGNKATNNDRLPLDEGAQKCWDLGRWRGKITVHGLVARYAGEIVGGKEFTTEMVDAYVSELAARKKAIAKLVDEKLDPDPAVAGKLMPCAAPRHYGANEPVELTQRFLLERGDDEKLRRKQHGKGDGGDIVAGELLRADVENFPGEVPPGEVKIEEGRAIVAFGVRYCSSCRSEALDDFRARKDLPQDHPDYLQRRAVLTFYTVAGLRLVAKREAESAGRIGQARNLEGAGSRRTFGAEYGTRKDSDWRRDRVRAGIRK